MTVKQFRCVTNVLTIRTQPALGDAYKTQQTLKMNDVISVDDTTRVEAAGYMWLKHSLGWSAERTSDGKVVYLLDNSLRPKDRVWGINIDPNNPAANPPASKLNGVGWVRFVFHAASRQQTIDQAFGFYDPIIRALAQQGTKILLVIIQDTFWGNGPWSNGNWGAYYPGYADALSKIAKHYKGLVAAYEIWNEMDLSGQPTSIYIAPENYGPLLLAASKAVKQADPTAKVISGGMVGSDPIGYLTKARNSIGGVLPIDGVGFHPYGQTPPDTAVFDWQKGGLGPSIQRVADAFNLPVWVTELGVPRVDVNNQNFWPTIANYMLKTFQLIHNVLFYSCPVMIWFAWADSQDRAGIVHDNQQQKGAIFDTFFQNVKADVPAYSRTIDAPYNGKVMLAHIAGQAVGEQTIADLARTVGTNATNVRALLVLTSGGTAWAGQTDAKKSLAINGPADLANWSAEFAKYRVDLHAWHVVAGKDVPTETALIAQAALAPGIGSIVLELDPKLLAIKASNDIRNFMIALKQKLPATFHIAASFDGRPENFAGVSLAEWYPFISSWHPKVFHWQWSNAQQGPDSALTAVFNALKQYPKPVIPILQAEPTGGQRVPPDQIKKAAKLSFDTYNAPAVTYWRLGAIGPAEFAAIQTVMPPYGAGYST
jgi:hypothetical protein